jgi:hypothetical protein
MSTAPVPLPRWFTLMRSIVVGGYILVGIGCLASGFVTMAIGAVVYRDFSSYSLYGNPWEPSSFPWYVIWPMRLMSIVALQVVVAVGFVILFVSLAALWPARLGTPLTKRMTIGSIATLIELGAAAWFGRWFG